jgi:DNA end-binding protein Ku
MSTMRFADEVVDRADVDGLPARRTKPGTKELKLATQIIDGLASDWNPDQYHDTFAEELRKRIAAKDNGRDIVEEPAPEERDADIVDLMAALEASVKDAKAGKAKRGGKKPAKRPARKSA